MSPQSVSSYVRPYNTRNGATAKHVPHLHAAAVPATAAGASEPEPGKGYIQHGASPKQADSSWDSGGEAFDMRGRFQVHDVRYGYVAGELGLFRKVSATWLVSYLNGLEGPRGDLHENTGFSDSWYGLKYELRDGSLPMALGFTVRTSILYDQEGPYTLEQHDDEGNFVGLSPEWRGLLKEDYTLSYLVSQSIADYRGWWNAGTGYTYREGAPADEIPIWGEIGYPLPWWDIRAKGTTYWVINVGNDSQREPDDRFGSRPGFNFNTASMGRVGVAFWMPFGSKDDWAVEAGFNQWVWGRSARRYQEPYLSLGRSF
jgi:hypothetical protein